MIVSIRSSLVDTFSDPSSRNSETVYLLITNVTSCGPRDTLVDFGMMGCKGLTEETLSSDTQIEDLIKGLLLLRGGGRISLWLPVKSPLNIESSVRGY
jgi:hypothetical protein